MCLVCACPDRACSSAQVEMTEIDPVGDAGDADDDGALAWGLDTRHTASCPLSRYVDRAYLWVPRHMNPF